MKNSKIKNSDPEKSFFLSCEPVCIYNPEMWVFLENRLVDIHKEWSAQ